VVAFLDSNHYDALVYPTMRRAALIGEPPRGSTCSLSAVRTARPHHAGGLHSDGLPIGVELLGRPLADARLVALAFDYEQSVHPRRAPSDTTAGRRTRAEATALRPRCEAQRMARGEFTFDPTRRTLVYDVRVSGGPTNKVYAVSIARDSREGRANGPATRAQGAVRSKGTLILGDAERRDLLAGRLVLALFTSEQSAAVARAAEALAPRETHDVQR
jgi:hypothetical protein